MSLGRHLEIEPSRTTGSRWIARRVGSLMTITAAALVAIMLVGGGGVWWWMRSGDSSDDENILLHTVERGDFELTLTERGEVEAFDVTEIRSLVKSNNTSGNAILRIVPEGTKVKKGDFLVELDSSALATLRTSQQILVNDAKAAEVEAHNPQLTAKAQRRHHE